MLIGGSEPVPSRKFGARAAVLHDLAVNGFPVPETVAISFSTADKLSMGDLNICEVVAKHFREFARIALYPSPEFRTLSSVKGSINVGLCESVIASLANKFGNDVANSIYADFVSAFCFEAVGIQRKTIAQVEDEAGNPEQRLSALINLYYTETGDKFPQLISSQLYGLFGGLAKKWRRSIRAARPDSASSLAVPRLGMIVQEMKSGHWFNGSGFGFLTPIDRETGSFKQSGHVTVYNGGRENFGGGDNPMQDYFSSSTDEANKLLLELQRHFRDPHQIEFSFDGKKIWILDSVPAERSVPAAIRIAVSLVKQGKICKETALSRVNPNSLGRVLHPQVARKSRNRVIARGIPASPGAATGVIAFTSRAAERLVGTGKNCILVRAETGPDDFKGMHVAQGVLTGRGGLTSHAAVVARGLGVPCVVGAAELQIVSSENELGETCRVLNTRTGMPLHEGDAITVDGTTGTVLFGIAELVEPSLNKYFESFLAWADEVRDIGVRANADTIDEVKAAKKFKADGIGLCRTEHMYFEESQLTVMRRMLFAESQEERKTVLSQLIQMQKSDFAKIFREMPGQTVCIRLFDPPLHEFLPRGSREMERLAEELGRDIKCVKKRAEELKEFNPMLGMRGVRVGIVMPEIYEMQARAIFEATVDAHHQGMETVPEIMIPLVSANREVELVQCHVDRVAQEVRDRKGVSFQFRLGVMVETPRAALRTGDFATKTDFLSFGTNDLTQMTYGLSRDDSQRFMEEYIRQGVYPRDPFSTLDKEGVGELLQIAAARARTAKEELTLSICGEHGGDPESIKYCRKIGFDYVSCSPYRVPIARLAAAQCVVAQNSESHARR